MRKWSGRNFEYRLRAKKTQRKALLINDDRYDTISEKSDEHRGRRVMEIYKKIFARMDELHISQLELSRRTGIATSTICDWKKKRINPQSDKLVSICKSLDMSLVDLLCDDEDKEDSVLITDHLAEDDILLESLRRASSEMKRRVLRYYEFISLMENDPEHRVKSDLGRNVSVIQDAEGKDIVVINDIIFKGKRSVNWKDVREYLEKYVGEFYTIASTQDIIYIGSDLPSEYSGSVYTKKLNGTVAKAKANAAQGIPELIEISVGKHFRENSGRKHKWNARNGWYRYDSRFALPVYNDYGAIERYNVFHASMIIRHANDGKMYLYDILDVKKETSTPLEP